MDGSGRIDIKILQTNPAHHLQTDAYIFLYRFYG